jgi:hypothetical protein
MNEVIYMTELETIQHAKNYLDKLAQGINPLTNEPVPEDELVNNVRISRCFFFVSDVLRRVIENGGVETVQHQLNSNRPPFSMDYCLLEHFSYSEYPLGINQIVGRINDLVPPDTTKRLTFAPIVKWLLEQGYLMEIESIIGDKVRHPKRPTQKGQQIGINTEMRSGVHGDYTAVVYDQRAQAFVVQHLPEMLKKS